MYVREAIANGKRGFYRGTTYEGLKNYTAYHTSSFSRLVGAPRGRLGAASTRPTRWSFVVAGLAGLGSLLLGGLLVVLVLRDMAERRRAEEMRCDSRRRWRRSASSPAASRTTSTIC